MSHFESKNRRERCRFLFPLTIFLHAVGAAPCCADEVARLTEGPISAVLESENDGYVVTIRATESETEALAASRVLTTNNPSRIILEFDQVIIPNPLSKPLPVPLQPSVTSFRVVGHSDRTRVELEFPGKEIPPFEVLPESVEKAVRMRISANTASNAGALPSVETERSDAQQAPIEHPATEATTRSEEKSDATLVLAAAPQVGSTDPGSSQQDEYEIYDAPSGFRVRRLKPGIKESRRVKSASSAAALVAPAPGASAVTPTAESAPAVKNPPAVRTYQPPASPTNRYSLFDDPVFLKRRSERVPALTVRDNQVEPVELENSKTISRISDQAGGETSEVTPPPILRHAMKSWGEGNSPHDAAALEKQAHQNADGDSAKSSAGNPESEGESSQGNSSSADSSLATSPQEVRASEEEKTSGLEGEGSSIGSQNNDVVETPPEEISAIPPDLVAARIASGSRAALWDMIGVGITVLGGIILLLVVLRTNLAKGAKEPKKKRYRRSDPATETITPVALAQNHLSIYYQVLSVSESASDEELELSYVQALEQCEEELQKYGSAFPERSRRIRQRIETVREAYKTLRQTRDSLS